MPLLITLNRVWLSSGNLGGESGSGSVHFAMELGERNANIYKKN